MAIFKNAFFVLLVSIILASCSNPYTFNLSVTKKTTLGKKIPFTLTEKNGNQIDSVQFLVNGKKIASKEQTAQINTNTVGIGKHIVSALVFYPQKMKKVNNSFEVMADKPYDVYTYKIINSYPHDKTAFTQGLEYYNGFLYETTGQRGKSTLRKVELKTGKVVKKVDLDSKYFGEGMTIFNNKIYWLTWQEKKGFVYNLDTFEQENEFAYANSKEGWGLTHNETELIKSDGTNKIWFLDPTTQKEKRAIQVYTHKRPIKELNELEYINGKIYINYWKKPLIAIVNPATGIVEEIANLSNLQKEMGKTQKLSTDEVLNGIAFDAKNNRIFVTGKHWEKIFEIELIKKQ